jgi:2-amino-4-hydroxy-6-hydroxymethyldihydropteridine diphosphokinase
VTHCVYLGLGSNRALLATENVDKKGLSCIEVLEAACKSLSSVLTKITCSSVYETKAMYVENQNNFYNMVVSGYFTGTAEELLIETQRIETCYGRNRNLEYRNGPRTLDIDIEYFGQELINTPSLIIPHERILERAFVLIPLLELLEFDKNNAEVLHKELLVKALESLGDQGVKKYRSPFVVNTGGSDVRDRKRNY